jgi:phospholipid/cholesterol/gamma-HCH transport system substrate-binding protein
VETRSNKFLVSFIVALVLAAILAFTLWMTANRRSSGRPYDIVIERSVSGLVVGSPVTFSGVPVGRVNSVRLDPVRPGAVRVRIDITDDNLPLTEGTVATLKGDLLFGTALLSLQRESRSDRPLLARAGEEAPIIPLQSGGLGDVVGDPTPMVESIAFATDRLLAATTPEQQRLLTARIEEMERTSGEIAAQGDVLGSRIAPARQSLRDTTASATASAKQARLMRQGLDQRSRTATRDMKASLAAARQATATLNTRLQASRPGVQGFSTAVAASGEQIAGAREGIGALKDQVQAVEGSGVGALISGPPTPDHKPKKSR